MTRLVRFGLLIATCAAIGAGAPAQAEAGGSVYKDRERFGPFVSDVERSGDGLVDRPHDRGPPRRVTGGPGYVGSEFGLGKPAFTGLGSRPDWGRSSD